MAWIRTKVGYIFVIRLVLSIGNLVSSSSMLDLLEDYNKTERPNTNHGQLTIQRSACVTTDKMQSRRNATTIELSMHVNAITSICEITMDYKIDILLRQFWRDDRLRHNETTYKAIGPYGIKDIWWPDTFFYNAKHGYKHDVTFPNELAQIYPDGQVKTSLRLAMKLSCTMLLQYFPMDEQRCSITLGSFGYATKDLLYTLSPDAVTFQDGLSLPEFIIDKENVKQKEHTDVYKTGNFSQVIFEFHMWRDFGFYLIQTYIPSMLIVILSWLSFWLDVHATPARISLGLLTVLTMTTQNTGINAHLPRVSYVKAIDIWMSTCLVFVFGALLEYAWANVLARREQDASVLKNTEITKLFDNRSHHANKGTAERNGNVTTNCRIGKSMAQQPLMTGDRLDKLSRIVFPVTFAFFNVVYWLHYWCRWFKDDKCR